MFNLDAINCDNGILLDINLEPFLLQFTLGIGPRAQALGVLRSVLEVLVRVHSRSEG